MPGTMNDFNEDGTVKTENESNDFDSEGGGNFISMKLGATAEFIVAKAYKDKPKDPDYNLSKRDYRWIVEADDGRQLTVGSWALYKVLMGKIKPGAKLRVSHPSHGVYKCDLI